MIAGSFAEHGIVIAFPQRDLHLYADRPIPLQMMRAADYIIDIGPGPAEMGGRVVAVGTPEEVARNEASVTGPYLAEELARVATESDD
mgnify:CR=1 FL=1